MTVRDLLALILRESGVIAAGQVPTAQDVSDALFRINVLIGQWQRKRWLVYQLVDVVAQANGQSGYSVGPGESFNIGNRPSRIYSAFFRQFGGAGTAGGAVVPPAPSALQVVLRDSTSPGGPYYSNQLPLILPPSNGPAIPDQPPPYAVDYPLAVIPSREDYSRISLKGLHSWPQSVWLETGWPLATAWFYPTPQAGAFELHLQLEVVLQTFQSLNDTIAMPPEYQAALLYNMVVRTRSAYAMVQDSVMVALAKDALATVREANLQIPDMSMPRDLVGRGVYNIYSDNADR